MADRLIASSVTIITSVPEHDLHLTWVAGSRDSKDHADWLNQFPVKQVHFLVWLARRHRSIHMSRSQTGQGDSRRHMNQAENIPCPGPQSQTSMALCRYVLAHRQTEQTTRPFPSLQSHSRALKRSCPGVQLQSWCSGSSATMKCAATILGRDSCHDQLRDSSRCGRRPLTLPDPLRTTPRWAVALARHAVQTSSGRYSRISCVMHTFHPASPAPDLAIVS
jgi:hypothetical protein